MPPFTVKRLGQGPGLSERPVGCRECAPPLAGVGWVAIEGGHQRTFAGAFPAVLFGELAGGINLARGVLRVPSRQDVCAQRPQGIERMLRALERRRQRAGGEAVVEPVIKVGAKGDRVRTLAVK